MLQRDMQRALLQKERHELDQMPEAELEELAARSAAKGLSVRTAREVAEELTEHDAFAAHAEASSASTPTI
jgi:VIT1/CCC1 family predicted Fe2+/Mn2+ transporter